jgi:hypothetical protein
MSRGHGTDLRADVDHLQAADTDENHHQDVISNTSGIAVASTNSSLVESITCNFGPEQPHTELQHGSGESYTQMRQDPQDAGHSTLCENEGDLAQGGAHDDLPQGLSETEGQAKEPKGSTEDTLKAENDEKLVYNHASDQTLVQAQAPLQEQWLTEMMAQQQIFQAPQSENSTFQESAPVDNSAQELFQEQVSGGATAQHPAQAMVPTELSMHETAYDQMPIEVAMQPTVPEPFPKQGSRLGSAGQVTQEPKTALPQGQDRLQERRLEQQDEDEQPDVSLPILAAGQTTWIILQNEIQSKLQASLQGLPHNSGSADNMLEQSSRDALVETLSKDLVSLVQAHVPTPPVFPGAQTGSASEQMVAAAAAVAANTNNFVATTVSTTEEAESKAELHSHQETDGNGVAAAIAVAVSTPSRQNIWALRLAELKSFKTIYGHCLVPKVYKENPPLGRVSALLVH